MSNLTKEKVIRAVEETGFPLELRTAKLFSSRGCFVANSLYFVDKDEGKGREIDLRVLINRQHKVGDRTLLVRYCLLVECKRYKKRPWVVFTNAPTAYDQLLNTLEVSGANGDNWRPAIAQIVESVHPLFKLNRMGRGYSEIFREGNHDEGEGAIYGALLTAVKSTVATKDSSFAAGANSICFYYPLVVLDGSLWESYLVDEKIDAEETSSAVISFFYESPNYSSRGFRVPIVTETGLPKFLEQLELSLDQISNRLFSDLSHFKES